MSTLMRRGELHSVSPGATEQTSKTNWGGERIEAEGRTYGAL
uniref:Uncharacterized protein n=1 Tax=Anguilla anguilla TaxID=7936 RepID=A0A0E9VIV0_ANGAN